MKTRKTCSLILCFVLLLSLCVPAFAAQPAPPEIKNVILMIGDGMGENHLKLAEEYGHTLFMNTQYDLRGQSKTRSASHITTDSAAGGTALSSGVRIINQTVGVFAWDPFGLFRVPKSIAEVAQEKGMKTGIVTTDSVTGATPASFSVHVLYRKMYDKLAQEILKTKFDLFWGKAEENATITPEAVAANGWTFVANKTEMQALQPGTRSFGQFSGQTWRSAIPEAELEMDPPLLREMSTKAIELLNADNENGFFLMIEGAHIDKQSHKSKGMRMDYESKREEVVSAVVGFDNAIRDVVEFARKDGHTAVVVTADHETGWIFKDRGSYRFHLNEHTASNVPVFVFGTDCLFKPGAAVKNKSIPVRLSSLLGWSKCDFPAKQPGKLTCFRAKG